MSDRISVTVWNEYRTEQENDFVHTSYSDGIHTLLAEKLRTRDFDVQTAVLDEPEHGLTDELLDRTDVLVWWGHDAHDEVRNEIVTKVRESVLDGMGIIVLHSGQGSKIFESLLGTSGDVCWRHADETERIWVIDQNHPITDGIDEYIELEEAATYGEPFDIPSPDDLVFVSWFEGGDIFRSGCCYYRRNGRIFYFRPGDERYPIYENEQILDVLENSVRWAATGASGTSEFGHRRDPPNQ